jgi:hypothetical protein
MTETTSAEMAAAPIASRRAAAMGELRFSLERSAMMATGRQTMTAAPIADPMKHAGMA